MKKTIAYLFTSLGVSMVLGAVPVLAEEAEAYRETKLGLYVSAKEAYELIQEDDRAVLIDVRDPIEIKFTGFAEPTNIHVPWVLADPEDFDEKSETWHSKKNEEFEAQVKEKIEALGVVQDDPIIVMCRSGATRSAPAADVITEMGYSEVYSVTDGFEGGKLEDGDSRGVRAKDGWRNSGLPWSYKINPGVAWQPEN
ncbi:MAG: sulfurtransferase [Halomonas sp.]|nr:sulfurtransferase [Halomonas sp.]